MMKRRLILLLATALVCPLTVRAETQDEAVRRHILAIRTDPSVKVKKAASEALAEIGLPSLAPLMDYLRQVAQAKPNDEIWISPGYIREALSAVCKRVGEDAEKALLERFLAVCGSPQNPATP